MFSNKKAASLLMAGIVLPWYQATADLLISEYVEGSSNNKALEFYNNSDASVDLSHYSLQFFFNGATAPGATINLQGTLSARATHVLAHSSAIADVLVLAQQTNGGSWFNGDDAIVLLNNGTVVDSIGQVGVDPGSAWSESSVSTVDMTLRRRQAVADTQTNDVYAVAEQWTAYPQNTFSDLGKVNFDVVAPPNPLGQCGDEFTRPHSIQGVTDASPLLGQQVVVEAVISAEFRGNEKLRGFYVQSPEFDYDNNSASSEALFVYDPSNSVSAPIGNRVRLLGTVSEFDQQTQLSSLLASADCGPASAITPSYFSLPVSNLEQWESVEGMQVLIDQVMTVSDTYNLARYGEVVLSAGGRLWQPTEVAAPGSDAQSVAQQNRLRRIVLDDGSSKQNPARIPYPGIGLTHDNPLRVGDEVRPFLAVLAQAFGQYRLHPVHSPIFDQRNGRNPAPSRELETQLRVASFNVLNYFNGDGAGGGFPTSRGASSADELFRQREKMLTALLGLDADIIGLMEVENDGDQPNNALREIVEQLNARSVNSSWQAVETGLLGTDEIRVALIYRADKVQAVGASQQLSSGAFATSNRVPLLQTFVQRDGVQRVTVVVNHLKSKGSCPTDVTDVNADHGDGQSCWNVLRTQAAKELQQWLSACGDCGRAVMIGDFNAYRKEDPVTVLTAAGYQLLNDHEAGSSFVFDGQSGQLDHAFANATLAPEIVHTTHWSINADEARALDYNVEFKTPQQQAELYAASPWRSSDHDPLLIDIGSRQFSQQWSVSDWRFIWGKQNQRYRFMARDDRLVNAMLARLKVWHSDLDGLTVTLRSPTGVETPLNFTLSGDSVKTMELQTHLTPQMAKGVWQLIVKPSRPGFGVLMGAEFKLD